MAKLQFLNNPQQRIATGKRLPTKPLEAIIMYGAAEQRAKAVKKTIPQSFALAQHNSTHHVVLTLIKHGGPTARVELLFAIRRKLIDLSRAKVGNYVIQELIAAVPKVQQKEIAKEFIEDLADHCRHPFANRVIQKMLTLPAAAEELFEELKGHIVKLAANEVGQHVISCWIEHSDEACAIIADTINVKELLGSTEESTVLCSLLKSGATPLSRRTAIIEAVLESLDKLVENKKHNHLLSQVVQSDANACASVLTALQPRLMEMANEKKQVQIVAALARSSLPVQRASILASLGDVVEAAKNPTLTLVLRALIEAGAAKDSDATSVPSTPVRASQSAKKKKRGGSQAQASGNAFEALATASAQLAGSNVASPVLQRLYEYGTDELRSIIFDGVQQFEGGIPTAMVDGSASFLLQAIMAFSDATTTVAKNRETVVNAVLANDDALLKAIHTSAGTHTVQKAITFADDNAISHVTDVLLGNDIKELALDCHASYTVQILLQELCRRPDLIEKKRELMAALKPLVFSLALSPWAGQIVLDAMLSGGSKQLADAIRNVIFLKADHWLSEVPATADGEAPRRPRRGGPPPQMLGKEGAPKGKPEGRKTQRDLDKTGLIDSSDARPMKKQRKEGGKPKPGAVGKKGKGKGKRAVVA